MPFLRGTRRRMDVLRIFLALPPPHPHSKNAITFHPNPLSKYTCFYFPLSMHHFHLLYTALPQSENCLVLPFLKSILGDLAAKLTIRSHLEGS